MKTWCAAFVLLLFEGLAKTAFGQISPLQQIDPLDPNSTGFHVINASVSSSYFSESIPSTSISDVSLPGFSNKSADISISAGFAWSIRNDRSSVSITYSPGYFRGFTGSSYRSFNQSLAIGASRKMNSKLTLAASVRANMYDFNQLLFAPTLDGNLSSVSATLDELLSGLLTGQSSNSALSQVLGLALVNGSPETAFFYGGRNLSAAASISLSYTQSARSSFSFSMAGMHTQYLTAGSSGTAIGPAVLIPVTNNASASLGWSYSLSPRTTGSIDVSSSRSLSRFADAYATQLTGSIGRNLSTRWLVDVTFGAGHITPVHEPTAPHEGVSPTFGGSVAYKFAAQTLVASYTRWISDSYGLGAYSSQNSNGAWNWSRPGSSFALSSGFGYSQLTGPGLPNTTSWTARASFNRRLSSQIFLNLSYSYAQFPEAVVLRAPNLAVSGLMAGLSWSPSAMRR